MNSSLAFLALASHKRVYARLRHAMASGQREHFRVSASVSAVGRKRFTAQDYVKNAQRRRADATLPFGQLCSRMTVEFAVQASWKPL
jgi:hypothetical protein